MTRCSLSAGGMRFTAAGKGTPSPGYGVEFEDSAGGSLFRCTISSNTAVGVLNTGTGRVRLLENNVFDNASRRPGRRSAACFSTGSGRRRASPRSADGNAPGA